MEITIHSSKRNINSLNRYNFNVNIFFKEFQPNKITLVKEDNNLFSSSSIIVQFNEKDNLQFNLKETKKFNDKEYYIYESITKDTLKCNNILDIKILNYLMINPCDKKDIYQIKQIKNINNNDTKYLCLEISEHDISVGDELGIIDINEPQNIIKSLFVNKCIKNYILTNLESIDLDKKYYCLQLNKNIEILGYYS